MSVLSTAESKQCSASHRRWMAGRTHCESFEQIWYLAGRGFRDGLTFQSCGKPGDYDVCSIRRSTEASWHTTARIFQVLLLLGEQGMEKRAITPRASSFMKSFSWHNSQAKSCSLYCSGAPRMCSAAPTSFSHNAKLQSLWQSTLATPIHLLIYQ